MFKCCVKGLIIFLKGTEDIMIRWKQILSESNFTFLSSSEHVGNVMCKVFLNKADSKPCSRLIGYFCSTSGVHLKVRPLRVCKTPCASV